MVSQAEEKNRQYKVQQINQNPCAGKTPPFSLLLPCTMRKSPHRLIKQLCSVVQILSPRGRLSPSARLGQESGVFAIRQSIGKDTVTPFQLFNVQRLLIYQRQMILAILLGVYRKLIC